MNDASGLEVYDEFFLVAAPARREVDVFSGVYRIRTPEGRLAEFKIARQSLKAKVDPGKTLIWFKTKDKPLNVGFVNGPRLIVWKYLRGEPGRPSAIERAVAVLDRFASGQQPPDGYTAEVEPICACCNRPLLDVDSRVRGLGLECWRRRCQEDEDRYREYSQPENL